MTNEQLSKRVSELFGIDEYSYDISGTEYLLHDDSARCFELMCQYGINIEIYEEISVEAWYRTSTYHIVEMVEGVDMHNNDKALATRIAILKCLLKMKG